MNFDLANLVFAELAIGNAFHMGSNYIDVDAPVVDRYYLKEFH